MELLGFEIISFSDILAVITGDTDVSMASGGSCHGGGNGGCRGGREADM